MTGTWVVVVPAKPFHLAKTRCRELTTDQRGQLARAMLSDVVRSLSQVPQVRAVIVAGRDPDVVSTALACGAAVAGCTAGTGLNHEVGEALTCAAQASPGARLAIAMADLPYASPSDFASALAAAQPWPQAIVADGEGTGTTMVMIEKPHDFAHLLGCGSRRKFTAAGFHDLSVTGTRLRRDVDTVAQLTSLEIEGLGAATRSWITSTLMATN